MPPQGRAPRGGVVILHGAGSCKESHHDFARAAIDHDLAALAFDLRGHGESQASLDSGVLDDLGAMAQLLRDRCGSPGVPIALRGSSMGGYLAIVGARAAAARAIVAICPASAEGLRRGLRSGRLTFSASTESLESFLSQHELYPALESLQVPLLLLHAEGDEQVPVEHSRELARRSTHPESRLITVPGGHHRSVQHDPELQAISLHWLERMLGEAE